MLRAGLGLMMVAPFAALVTLPLAMTDLEMSRGTSEVDGLAMVPPYIPGAGSSGAAPPGPPGGAGCSPGGGAAESGPPPRAAIAICRTAAGTSEPWSSLPKFDDSARMALSSEPYFLEPTG